MVFNKLNSSGMRDVLIVDDEEDILEAYKIILKRSGLFRKIVTAKNGQEALNKITNQEFSLVITDINMPKIDGKKLIEYLKDEEFIKKTKRQQPIIIISGYLNADNTKFAIDNGVKNILTKPFNKENLLKRIKELLNISVED